MVDLFGAMGDLGEAVFHQSNMSHIISSSNIGKNSCTTVRHCLKVHVRYVCILLTRCSSGGTPTQLQP